MRIQLRYISEGRFTGHHHKIRAWPEETGAEHHLFQALFQSRFIQSLCQQRMKWREEDKDETLQRQILLDYPVDVWDSDGDDEDIGSEMSSYTHFVADTEVPDLLYTYSTTITTFTRPWSGSVIEVCFPPQNSLGFAFGPWVRGMSGYGITNTWDEMMNRTLPGAPADCDTEIEGSTGCTEFATRVRQDTNEIYVRGYAIMYYGIGTAGSNYRVTGSGPQEIGGDYRDAGSGPQETGIVHRGTKAAEETSDPDDRKMALKKRTTRLNPETTTTTPATTYVTNAQLKAMIDQGVTATLAAHNANTNGVDSHNSGTYDCGNDIAYAMTWTELKKKMTDKYCPRTEIKKLEVKLWDLKVKGTDVIGYNQRFQELALLCVRMFPEESDKIERYVSCLPDMIHRSVVASKPKTMQEATEIATELIDKRICNFAECQIENKRKQDNNQQQQLQNKRQSIGRAYAAWIGEKKLYGGSRPLCPKYNYHHDGPCAPKCCKCNRVGHLAHDCRSPANANTTNNQRGTGTGQKPTCYECGAQGYFKRECPKLKNNNNRGNPAGNVNAPAKMYVVGHAGTNPDSNVVTGTFLLNNSYASILFDTGADRSFVSTAFSP
ncbi:reverse transcriptase domain-containing protein [Tanacetum coccineum]